MRVLRYTESEYAAQIQRLASASSLFDPAIEKCVARIVERVRSEGDQAVLALTAKYDRARLRREQIAVTPAERVTASLKASPEFRRAVAEAVRNIATFSQRSLRRNWMARNSHGARVGEKYDPLARVGIYVPAGTAPLVSTALMTVVLAQVAGCREIVVCTPSNADGEVNASLLYALNAAGATEIYRIGGAQAVAAMALGTPTIPKVQKIFGPGNAYVVAAKRLLFGFAAIDLLPGPSEVLILADHTAKARYVAADLLAQAEHGSGHERLWLVTPSARLLDDVRHQIDRRLPQLARREYVARVWERNTWFIQVKDVADGVRLANQLAPEHCEIMTRKPAVVAREIRTAGALLLGPYTPAVLGDYVAGPSHELPTGGAGSAFSGLTVDQFQRRTSVVEYGRRSLQKAQAAVRVLANLEGLTAHAQSAAIRLESL